MTSFEVFNLRLNLFQYLFHFFKLILTRANYENKPSQRKTHNIAIYYSLSTGCIEKKRLRTNLEDIGSAYRIIVIAFIAYLGNTRVNCSDILYFHHYMIPIELL